MSLCKNDLLAAELLCAADSDALGAIAFIALVINIQLVLLILYSIEHNIIFSNTFTSYSIICIDSALYGISSIL